MTQSSQRLFHSKALDLLLLGHMSRAHLTVVAGFEQLRDTSFRFRAVCTFFSDFHSHGIIHFASVSVALVNALRNTGHSNCSHVKQTISMLWKYIFNGEVLQFFAVS